MAVILDSLPAAQATATSLAPGFRFHPTDEELVWYYLRRKICRKPFRIDAISDVEVYKVEPWDLPDLSRIKSRDLEWYFFSVLDKKYGNGSRTNRATDKGYWKTTGKDRDVYHRSRLIGMKKTLVYHIGRAPKGERTNWVMHEYRLIDHDLERSGVVQDAFVLCRIFRKSGSGPKNGEQYGAPFIDEEWEDDELIMVPKQDPCRVLDDVDDAYLDADDLEQILGDDVSNGQPRDDQSGSPKFFDLPVRNELDPNLVKHEYISEPNDAEDIYVDYLLDQPYFDASTSFLETEDLKNVDSLGNDEILENANEETHQLSEVCHEFFEGQKSNFASTSNQENPDLATMERNPETCEASQQLFEEQGNDGVLSLKQEDAELPTDFAYPFLHRGSCMMGNISSSSPFSSESSGKYLAAASQASTSIRVTTGMIRIRDVCFTGSKFDLSLTKKGHLSIVLSLQLEQSEGSFVNSHEDPGLSLSSRKHGFVLRRWLYCLLLWIVVLSVRFKIRSLLFPSCL